MNGYILIDSREPTAAEEPVARMLRRLEIQVDRLGFGSSVTLLLWGGLRGDVRHASSSLGNLIILDGYLSEVPGYAAIADQQGALDFLLTVFERASSLEDLAKFAEQLNGSFTIVFRDGAQGRILCLTDRVASRPAAFAQVGKDWAVSSHSCALASVCGSVHLDRGSLVSVMLHGGPMEPSKSLFEGIDPVLPGNVTELQRDGIKRTRAWYRFHHHPDLKTTPTGWTDLVSGRLVRAAERIGKIHTAPAVFLSGGIDSRLAVAALSAAGLRPHLVTLGDSANLEIRVASAAAKAFRLPQQVILRDKHWYLRGLQRAVFQTGGSFIWTHAHFSQAAQTVLSQNQADSFMLGDFCEAFSKLFCSTKFLGGRRCTPDEFVAGFDRLPLPLYRPADREASLSLLRADSRREAEHQLKIRIKERYERLSGVSDDFAIALDHFFRWESGATLATFSMFQDLRSVSAECNMMFDKEVHELLEVLPSQIRDGANFGSRLISKLNWRAGWVPNASTLLPICFPPAAHRLAKRIKPFVGRARRQIFGKSHRTTGSWPEKAVLYAHDPEWRQAFADLLDEPDDFLDQVFDREAIRRCWRDFLNGDGKRAGDVEQLVNLTVLSRLLVGR